VTNASLNGIKYAYYIYYRLLDSPTRLWDVVASVNTSRILIDLSPGRKYGIRMTVAIMDGNGIASEEMEVTTIEGRM